MAVAMGPHVESWGERAVVEIYRLYYSMDFTRDVWPWRPSCREVYGSGLIAAY